MLNNLAIVDVGAGGNMLLRVAQPDAQGFVDLKRFVAGCLHGRDRTGIVMAARRIIRNSWTAESAIREMGVYGVNGLTKLFDFDFAGYGNILHGIEASRPK